MFLIILIQFSKFLHSISTGYGVFVIRPMKANEFLFCSHDCVYKGEVISTKQKDQLTKVYIISFIEHLLIITEKKRENHKLTRGWYVRWL